MKTLRIPFLNKPGFHGFRKADFFSWLKRIENPRKSTAFIKLGKLQEIGSARYHYDKGAQMNGLVPLLYDLMI